MVVIILLDRNLVNPNNAIEYLFFGLTGETRRYDYPPYAHFFKLPLVYFQPRRGYHNYREYIVPNYEIGE